MLSARVQSVRFAKAHSTFLYSRVKSDVLSTKRQSTVLSVYLCCEWLR